MSDVIITSPAEYYPNPTKDKPLFNGQMYIGVPDTDAEDIPTNQKQVKALQENGSTVNISQPIAISPGGVPVDGNGDVYIRLLVDGNYSQVVLDNLGGQSYYIPNAFLGQPLTPNSPEIIFRIEFTTDILTDTASPDAFESDYYDSNKAIGSGAKWIKDGTIGAAGTFDLGTGHAYNDNGDGYLFGHSSVKIAQFGGTGLVDDSSAAQDAIDFGLIITDDEGTFLISDLTVTGKTEFRLGSNATLKSIAELLPEIAIPTNIWSLTSKIFDVTGSGASLKIKGGTIDCSGARPDGLPASNGPTGNTPDFGEYAIHAEGADSLIIHSKIINYLSDGAVGAPNGDLCIKANDTAIVELDGSEFYEIGNEVCFITSSVDCTFSMDNVKAIGSRGSFNAEDLTKVMASDGDFQTFSGSPLNLFSDNTTCCRNKVKDVTNSHGIDFSEGLHRFRNIICTENIIKDVTNNGILGNGIDSIFADNIIINAGNFGINCDNSIGGVTEGNIQITDNTIIDCSDGGISLKGVGGVSYDATVTGNTLMQNSIIAGSIGILLNNHSDINIDDNIISGYADNHFQAVARINNVQLTRNKFKQPHGASNQSGDIVLFNAQSDAFSLNDIVVGNNEFEALPPIGEYSINFTGYTLEYGRFPNGTNLQVTDNTGVVLWTSDDEGVMYSSTKGNTKSGTAIEGRFNGGDIVLTKALVAGQPSGYRILMDSALENGVYTFRASPATTISTTMGDNDATISSVNHEIQEGDTIRILDIDGVGGTFDTMVIERDVNSGAVVLRDAPANTAAGKNMQFLGNALGKALSISTL